MTRFGSIHLSETRKAKNAFTILELLVAITILVILVTVVGRVVSSASNSIVRSESYLDIDREARLVFDRLAVDIGRMIRRRDLYYGISKNSGNDRFDFFSEVKGVSSGDARSNYSIVNYQVNNDYALTRAVVARSWFDPFILANDVNHNLIQLGGEYFTVMAPSVFRFEYTFLLKPTSTGQMRFSNRPYHASEDEEEGVYDPTRIRGFRDVAAIVVGLALLDEKSRMRNVDISQLAAQFPDSSENSDLLKSWKEVAKGLNESEGAQNVRVYQRFFYLN